jgi:UDP-4-amino-4,6-dideoxy-N-acetyl-beta-L-altrosamine transaminase
MQTATFLPYGRQEISDADVQAVAEALRDPMITQGPRIEAFERAFAQEVGARHAVAFSSGTAALHGAAFAARLGPGDEVLAPPLTFAGSTNCALYQGASARFVDIDWATWNLDAAAAAAAVTPASKAIVPVSFAGLPADLAPLDAVRDRVVVIEDAAHALGAVRDGRPVGGPGGADMTCFSLHPVKLMTTGEGGMVTTENDGFAARMRAFRTHGIVRENVSPGPYEGGWYYEMQELGFNYRITDVQCALGMSQLERIRPWIQRRNALAARYRELLAGDERIGLPPAAPEGWRHAYHLFVIHVRAGAEARLRTFEALRAAGIGVQVHYIPVYRLPYYRDVLGVPQDECPATERYYEGAITLPLFPAMTDDDIDRVVEELGRCLP